MYNLTSFFGALRTFKNQNGPRNLKKIEQVVFMILNMEKKKKKLILKIEVMAAILNFFSKF